MNKSSRYLEQFNRVKRWYQEFYSIDKGRLHDRSSDCYEDYVYAFFQNCHHLKDWIRNDGSIGSAAAKVEEFINNNPELCLCAKICNGTKHLRSTNSRSSQDPQFGRKKFKFRVGGPPTMFSAKYIIDTKVEPVDAFELATKCLQAWESYIRSNISPTTI